MNYLALFVRYCTYMQKTAKMMIPKLHYIVQGNSGKELLEHIQKACTSGIELVQLGIPDVSEKKFLKIATEARAITAHYQTRLLIENQFKIAKDIKADGVLLSDKSISPTEVRKQLYTWQMIGAIANTVQDCETFLIKEVDYIGLGPFKQSTNKDVLNPKLGFNGFTLITESLQTETPIIAYGGVTTEDVTELLASGVSGIAVSDEITNNFDAIKVFNQLLKASSSAEQRYTFE